jgi:hypothetical protein
MTYPFDLIDVILLCFSFLYALFLIRNIPSLHRRLYKEQRLHVVTDIQTRFGEKRHFSFFSFAYTYLLAFIYSHLVGEREAYFGNFQSILSFKFCTIELRSVYKVVDEQFFQFILRNQFKNSKLFSQ